MSLRRDLSSVLGFARGAKRALRHRLRPVRPNLRGDRDVEWSFVAAHVPALRAGQDGAALDFGAADGFLSLIAAQRGYRVTAVDLDEAAWTFEHPRIRFVQGDILTVPLEEHSFDVALNCSTVEHVGIAGRYGTTRDEGDGDLAAMARMRELLKPSGVMVLTIPVGVDALFAPLCRVYGEQRLPRLLAGYQERVAGYWVKDDANRWIEQPRDRALKFRASVSSWDPLENVYALGCFVLAPR